MSYYGEFEYVNVCVKSDVTTDGTNVIVISKDDVPSIGHALGLDDEEINSNSVSAALENKMGYGAFYATTDVNGGIIVGRNSDSDEAIEYSTEDNGVGGDIDVIRNIIGANLKHSGDAWTVTFVTSIDDMEDVAEEYGTNYDIYDTDMAAEPIAVKLAWDGSKFTSTEGEIKQETDTIVEW